MIEGGCEVKGRDIYAMLQYMMRGFSSIFANRDRCMIIVLFMERKKVIFSSIFAIRDRCKIIAQNLQMKKSTFLQFL